jgi:hypothetical protein
VSAERPAAVRFPEIAALASRLRSRVEELGDSMAKQIVVSVDAYTASDLVQFDELARSCTAHVETLLYSLGSTVVSDAAARETGRLRAEKGFPLPDLMSAYRVGSRFVWETIASAAEDSGVSSKAVISAASEIWEMQAVFTEAMSTAYRDVVARQMLRQEEERSALVAALLEGRTAGRATLWEVADLLRLPHQGPYVVVAADVPEPGKQALAGIEDRLRIAGLPSAWRLLSDLQVGIVSVSDTGKVDRMVADLRDRASGRVGVSPPYEKLFETSKGLRLARIALAGSTPDQWVTVFDADPLRVAAVGDPELMGRFVANVLGGLADLPADERTILLDTFRVWSESRGSANDAAEKLYCHPNTVRHRLRKLQERTGRSVTDPRATAELCLAVEADRRLR